MLYTMRTYVNLSFSVHFENFDHTCSIKEPTEMKIMVMMLSLVDI